MGSLGGVSGYQVGVSLYPYPWSGLLRRLRKPPELPRLLPGSRISRAYFKGPGCFRASALQDEQLGGEPFQQDEPHVNILALVFEVIYT